MRVPRLLAAIPWALFLSSFLFSCKGQLKRADSSPAPAPVKSEAEVLPVAEEIGEQGSQAFPDEPPSTLQRAKDPGSLHADPGDSRLVLLAAGTTAVGAAGVYAFLRRRRRMTAALPKRRGSKGKIVVAGSGVLALLTLILTGFAFKDPILERWYLGRLVSKDIATRDHAIGRLAELRSERAIPHLLEIVRREGTDPNNPRSGRSAFRALLAIGPKGIAVLLEESASLLLAELRQADDASQRSAVLLAMEMLRSPDVFDRWEAVNLLRCAPRWSRPAVPALRAASKDKAWLVRESSKEVLAAISHWRSESEITTDL